MRTNRKLIVCVLSLALLLGMIPSTSISAATIKGRNNIRITKVNPGYYWILCK